MSSRLCSICNAIFNGDQILNQQQPHHQSCSGFLRAAEEGCYVCQAITRSPDWQFVGTQERLDAAWYLSHPSGSPEGFFRLSIDTLGIIEEGSADGEDEALDGVEEVHSVLDEAQETEGAEGELDDWPGEENLVSPVAWGFHLQPVSDLKDCVGEYVPPACLGDPAVIDLARRWFEKCCNEHPSCGPRDPTFRPTRLVEIVDEATVRVVSSHKDPDIGAYAAFSHCWGQTKALMLLDDSLELLYSGMPIENLPTSYEEAISMCRSLGIRYIWIDSICIIQDDEEDWRREAATMKDVYRNSSLNICACAAAESSQPSFASRQCSSITPIVVSPTWTQSSAEQLYLCDAEIYQKEIEDSPLRTRAWVLQEVWLSRRSLNLTKNQLWWECREQRACESFPGGLPTSWLSEDLANDLDFHRLHLNEEERDEVVRPLVERHRSWSRLVELYSRCGLTVMSDKLMAFSGIAEVFEQIENPGDEYAAGLWRRLMPASLYWTTTKLEKTQRPDVYRAPSWSWASIEGAVAFPPDLDRDNDGHSDVTPLCEILSMRMKLVDEGHKTGPVVGGALELDCWVFGERDHDPDGTIHFWIYEAPQELSNALGEARWALDETTEEGEIAMSTIDVFFLPEDYKRGYMHSTHHRRRRLTGEYVWDTVIKCVPLFESLHGGRRSARGLLVVDNDWGVYQRIGEFSHMPLPEDGFAGLPDYYRRTILLI